MSSLHLMKKLLKRSRLVDHTKKRHLTDEIPLLTRSSCFDLITTILKDAFVVQTCALTSPLEAFTRRQMYDIIKDRDLYILFIFTIEERVVDQSS